MSEKAAAPAKSYASTAKANDNGETLKRNEK